MAPLIPASLVQADNGTSVSVLFREENYTLDLGLLASIDRQNIGRSEGNLGQYDYEIRRALDRIFTGF